MNDRFRFRVWNETEKVYLKMPETHCDLVGFFLSCMEDEILEQCTGLRDINGRLIYEGDFFRPNIAKEKEKVFGIITFGKYDDFSQSLGFYVKWKGYPAEETEHGYKGWRKDLIFWLERGEIEIIGNIHENADLLKEKSEKAILGGKND